MQIKSAPYETAYLGIFANKRLTTFFGQCKQAESFRFVGAETVVEFLSTINCAATPAYFCA